MTIAYVGGTTNTSSGSAVGSLATTGYTPVIGNLLVFNVQAYNTGALPTSLSDGHNTYSAITGVNSSAETGSWYYGIVTYNTSLSFLETPHVNAYMATNILEYSFSGTMNFIGSNTGAINGSTVTTGTVAFSGTGNFLAIGFGVCSGANALSLSSPYTTRKSTANASGATVAGDQLNLASSSSPVSSTTTYTGATIQIGCCLVFQEVLGGTVDVPYQLLFGGMNFTLGDTP